MGVRNFLYLKEIILFYHNSFYISLAQKCVIFLCNDIASFRRFSSVAGRLDCVAPQIKWTAFAGRLAARRARRRSPV